MSFRKLTREETCIVETQKLYKNPKEIFFSKKQGINGDGAVELQSILESISYHLTTIEPLREMANVSGLPVKPADIQIMDLQAKTSSSMSQSLFPV